MVSWWLLGCPPTLPVVVTTGRAPGIEWVGARDTPRYPHRAQGCPPRAEWGPWLSHSEMRLVPQPRPPAIPVRMPWSLLGHLTRAPREGGLAPPARPSPCWLCPGSLRPAQACLCLWAFAHTLLTAQNHSFAVRSLRPSLTPTGRPIIGHCRKSASRKCLEPRLPWTHEQPACSRQRPCCDRSFSAQRAP